MITAVIFDVDGVLTDTATIHFQAWRDLFQEILPATVAPFDRSDYERLVDGRSRQDGLRAVLQSRSLSSTPEAMLCRFATRKQEFFLHALAAEPAPSFPDASPCLARLERDGIALAAASSSRNARAVLTSCGLLDRFDAVVDGVDVARLDLDGKPAPDLFLHAAELIDATPAACAVVEDSLAGLRAGRAGGFGLVVAVDRSGLRGVDIRRASDRVVVTLDEIDPVSLCGTAPAEDR